MLDKSYREICDHLRAKIVGQPRVIAQLERSLKIIEAGLRDPDKPLVILMFAGPSGTGKSEVPRVLAEAIHGDPDELCRIDCNLLSGSHSSASLTGSPPGYVGSTDDADTLINKRIVEGKPGKPGILVFEEFEKADSSVFDTLLGVFDKALLQMNNGRKRISFANTIIILTSNLGARELANAANHATMGFAPTIRKGEALPLSGEQRRSIVEKEMKRVFKPEFINRLDDTIIFRWLDQPELMVIVNKFIDELNVKLATWIHVFCLEDSAARFLVARGFDLANGARPLKRTIRKYVEDPLAEALIDGMPYLHCLITATHQEGQDQLTFEYQALIKKPRHKRPAAPKMIEAAAPAPVISEENVA